MFFSIYRWVICLVSMIGLVFLPTVVYALDENGGDPTNPNAMNRVYLPLIATQREVDTSGVFQVFALDAATQTMTPVGAQAAGVCIRGPLGPGRVNWKFANPGQSGAKYSVKPETSVPLVWAKSPAQDIDGIYRMAWGNCTALKVPDSCTVDVNSDNTMSACCNAAMATLGHVVKWTNTCSSSSAEAGWPDNPLR